MTTSRSFNFNARRRFLRQAALGSGSLALTGLLNQEGLLSTATAATESNGQHVPGPHFAPKAKSIIWLFMPGSPSQVDTFDFKPQLQKRDGHKLEGRRPKNRVLYDQRQVAEVSVSFPPAWRFGSIRFGDFPEHGEAR